MVKLLKEMLREKMLKTLSEIFSLNEDVEILHYKYLGFGKI